MERNDGTIKLEDISQEQIADFYEWLQGKNCPKGFNFKRKLNLSEEEAFSIIYYLQECLGVLPDNYERCRECGDIYDSCEEGVCISEITLIDGEDGEVEANFPEEMHGMYCNNCRPDYIDKPWNEWIKEGEKEWENLFW